MSLAEEITADVAVLGGGSGGYATALRAAELGRRVVIVEEDKVGGTCLHRGCIPTKALLHVGESADAVREAAALGVQASFEGIDVGRMQAFRTNLVDKKYKGLQGLLRARGVEVVTGRGRLAGPSRIEVGDTAVVAPEIVLATGARTRSLPGLVVEGRVLTSESALSLEDRKSVV